MQLINVSQILHRATGFLVTTKCISVEETEEGSEVFLCPFDDLTTHSQDWMLDYRIDGAFLIVSMSRNRLVITCDNATQNCSSLENTKLVMRKFTGEDNQLWKCDEGYIESVKFEGYVISPSDQSKLVLSVKEADNKKQLLQLKVCDLTVRFLNWFLGSSALHLHQRFSFYL